MLGILEGLKLVVLKKSLKTFLAASPYATFDHFTFYYTGFVALVLAIPAFVSYSLTVVPYDASWESIDYVSTQR